MKHRTARLVRVLVVVVVLVALVLFLRTINWGETWRVMRTTSPAILAAAALANLISLFFKGVRWHLFLKPVGDTPLWLAVRATFAGAGLNNILIANAGEAARVLVVARRSSVTTEKILATLALERLFEIVGFVLLLAISASVLTLPPALNDSRPYAFAILAVLVGFLIYLTRHPESAEMPVLEGEGMLHRAKHYGRGFLRTITQVSTPGRFGLAMAATVIIWGLQAASYHLTAVAAGFPIPVVATIAALLAANLGFAIRTTPGNVGVFQLLYAMTIAALGFDKDTATGVALLIQAQQVLPVTILGILAAPEMLTQRKTARPEDLLPDEPSA
jgi:uncharacterized protein (TIRG00374 family)